MRPISRTALGAAAAAVLAATAVGPSAAQPADGASGAGKRPIVGSAAAGEQPTAPVTVTLVTGDRILVSTDTAGRTAATAMPRPDGSQPLVQTRQSGQDLYVYPQDAVKALAAGKADPELFNVTGLVRQGYDDAHTKKLPLIAVYDASVNVARSAPPAPRGADRSLVLTSIGAVALTADKEQAAAFWSDVTGTDPHTRSVAGGLKKLWLDGKVRANLERSTQQVAAPAAWAAGYDGKGTKVAVLDTGTDLDHPDLRGRVTASKNFTDSDTDADRQGHGTHTISTVGGSGAESGGARKGVAPGAELLSGKVLNDGGYGLDSWIIAGMEWAVEAKADVVSMSLGDPTQTACDDPLAAAAERLSRQGPLFVVAAGNSGPGNNTVSSPGCAPSALTVGAVDRDDTTAPFSSRGPAGLQHTLKPEIAAPGVGISAAAAGGRGVYAYQSMSGTSMATPHVAGAAAVVKQRHPDWSGQQIKAVLVGSADTRIPGDVRETGGGRLDVKAAIDTTVTGAPAVQGGVYNWPQDRSDRTTAEVPYTNTGKSPVTLALAVEKVTGNDGSPVRGQVARLDRRTVTVAAGATVKVPLALDPAARLERSQYGDVTGRVVATANGVRVSTPFSLSIEPETVTLRVKLVDRAGRPASGPSSLDVIGTDDATGERRFNEGAVDQVYRVRPGAYFLSAFVATPDAGQGEGDRLIDSLTYLGRPQVELKKDTTVVLDARRAGRLDIAADQPVEARNTTLGFARSWDDVWLHAGTAMGGRTIRGFYASVEGRAKDGGFEFASYWRAAAPLVSELKAVGGPALHPITASTGSDNLDGTGSARLVDAGSGTPGELAAAGARGAIVLVKAADGALYEVAQNAKAAGAKAVLAHREAPGRWTGFTGYAGGALPALTIESTEAKALLARLATGKVTLSWKATARSPYVYSLALPEKGEVGGHTYRVRDRDLGRTESTYNSMGVAADFIDLAAAYRPIGTAVYFGGTETVAAPGTRTEYHSAGDTAWDQLLSSSFPWGEFMVGEQRTYAKGQRNAATWYDGITGPVAPRDLAGKETLAAERQGNLIGFAPAMWGDSGHAAQPGSFGDIGSLVLKRGGEVVGESWYPFGVFEVPAEEGRYELTQSIEKIGPPARVWQRSTAVQTTWGFSTKLDASAYSQGLAILFPRYTAPLDGRKTVAAADGRIVGLGATGHAGYVPGALKSAKLSYSYDGESWTQAKVSERGGRWSAVVDHAGASGKSVSLKVELADAKGAVVTQTVVRAYDVR
ncbi:MULTISPECIES: S8 family peptidase [Streptomyces]|uniref:S8 family peptidase n=1 Tax=Streptomyces TaxID=1883 RepID=UPI00207A3506|nr:MULTISPECIES: S8 family serine peptidase [Streptomyces]MCM9082648.1 S8 family serine peptidase [Streptomyces spororaveus]MCX5302586.1 S8 family serine peptidase [Streptomyces sp. NBC_00160]